MAASSTDAYSNNNRTNVGLVGGGGGMALFANYPVMSVSTDPANFWPGDKDLGSNSSVSPSSERNWEIDEEETVKRRLYELKRQFHNGRYLVFRHLPRDATEEDIRSLLQETLVHSVQINSLNGTARVLLVEPEVLESWSKTTERVLNGHKVSISPSNTDGVLCIARLPQDFSEDDFHRLVSSYGQVNYSFLMRSEKTGESKGYGFVQFVNKETAMHAKTCLEGRELRDSSLVCEWLDPSHVTVASLHSTTLYVDRLPKDYRNMGEFRNIFSRVASPPYCQIAMMHGAIQNWGLVEYKEPDEAEESRNQLNNFTIQGQRIRVSFYVPGVRAINLYTKLLNNPSSKTRGALLPEPPTNKVFTQLKNLTKQNPAFAKSLQNIILTQIHALQEKTPKAPSQIVEANAAGVPLVRPARVVPPPHSHPGLPVPFHQPPFVPHLAFPPMIQPVIVPQEPDKPPQEQPLNSNAQAALAILLAAQLQQQQEPNNNNNSSSALSNGAATETGANILSNPQILNLLQTLVSQGDPHHKVSDSPAVFASAAPTPSQSFLNVPPPPPSHLPQPQQQPPPGQLNNNAGPPSVINLSSSLKANFRNGYFKNGSAKLQKGPLLPTPNTATNGSLAGPGAALESAADSLDLGRVGPVLSDLLNGVEGHSSSDLSSSLSSLLSNAQSLQHLLGSVSTDVSQPPALSPSPASLPPPQLPPTVMGNPPLPQVYPPPSVVNHPPVVSMIIRAPAPPDPTHAAEHFIPHLEVPPPYLVAPPRIPPPPPNPWTDQIAHPQALFHSPVSIPQPVSSIQTRLYSPAVYLASPQAVNPQQHFIRNPHFTAPSGGFTTPPVAKKRKSNQFLPSPEPSPENGYVGQHSQGIGGHYQDSYVPKKQKRR